MQDEDRDHRREGKELEVVVDAERERRLEEVEDDTEREASERGTGQAAEITQLARTPTSCAILKSSVEARSCIPRLVRLINNVMPTSRRTVTIHVVTSSFEISTPLTSN